MFTNVDLRKGTVLLTYPSHLVAIVEISNPALPGGAVATNFPISASEYVVGAFSPSFGTIHTAGYDSPIATVTFLVRDDAPIDGKGTFLLATDRIREFGAVRSSDSKFVSTSGIENGDFGVVKPFAANDANLVVNQNDDWTLIDLTGRLTDGLGQAVDGTPTGVTVPENGKAKIEDGHIYYRPNPDYHGADSFCYTAADGTEQYHDTACVNVIINQTNGTHVVVFDLGAYGTRTGGGDLAQIIIHGGQATQPEIVVANGWAFTGWDVDFSTVTRPLQIQAQYAKYYSILARGGTTPPEAYAGEKVEILANVPLEGRVFSRWVGDIGGLENPGLPTTVLTMPAEDVTINTAYTFEIPLEQGWNAVALPFLPLDGDIASALQPTSRSDVIDFTAWSWNGDQFEPTHTMSAFQGVWIFVAESATLTFEGTETDAPSFPTDQVWLLVGPKIRVDLGRTRAEEVKSWHCLPGGVYKSPDALYPGRAYWLWMDMGTSLDLDAP